MKHRSIPLAVRVLMMIVTIIVFTACESPAEPPTAAVDTMPASAVTQVHNETHAAYALSAYD